MCIRDRYITQEIQVGYQTSFKVVLKDDTKTLDEIIVVKEVKQEYAGRGNALLAYLLR